MARQNFNTQSEPKEGYTVPGSALNKIGHAMQIGSAGTGGGCGAMMRTGHIATSNPPLDDQLGVFVMRADAISKQDCTDQYDLDENPCIVLNGPASDSFTGRYTGQQLPTKVAGRLIGRFRWYDNQNGTWNEYDQDVNMDVGGYWEGYLHSGTEEAGNAAYTSEASMHPGPATARSSSAVAWGYGAIPGLYAGEGIAGFWHQQRGQVIPILEPPEDKCIQSSTNIWTYGTPGPSISGPSDTRNTFVEALLWHQPQGETKRLLDTLYWRTEDLNCCPATVWIDTRHGFGSADLVPGSNWFNIELRLADDLINTVFQPTAAYRMRFQYVGNKNSRYRWNEALQIERQPTTNSGVAVPSSGAGRWQQTVFSRGRYNNQPTGQYDTTIIYFAGEHSGNMRFDWDIKLDW